MENNKYLVTRAQMLKDMKIHFLERWERINAAYGTDYTKHEFFSWVKPYVEGKLGLDIACGDWKINEAIGVDKCSRLAVLASDGLACRGDMLHVVDTESQDFVMSNYADAFNAPLVAFREWHRVLKRGGELFLCVPNSDSVGYSDTSMGPLRNSHRHSCFTKFTLKFYLNRTPFNIIYLEIQEDGNWIFARAKKS